MTVVSFQDAARKKHRQPNIAVDAETKDQGHRLIEAVGSTDLKAKLRLVGEMLSEQQFDYDSEVNIAKRFVGCLETQGKVVSTRGALYLYNATRGAYEEIPHEDAVGLVSLLDGAVVGSGEKERPLLLSDAKMNGIIKCAKKLPSIFVRDFFEQAARGVLMANYFMSVTAQNMYMHEHSAEHRARFGLDFDFDEQAPTDEFVEFLHTLFAGDADACEKIDFLGEYVGACLIGAATEFQKAVFLVGPGGNGKSCVLDIINRLFPPDTITAIPPDCFGSDYHRARMAVSKINICNELDEKEIMHSASLKAIITGDPITGRQPYGNVFEFRPSAGHLFACNGLPAVADISRGLWRRFVIIQFNRNFENDPARMTPKELVQRLQPMTPQIVRWALDGALRLLENGAYTIPPSHHDLMSEWQLTANSVAAWFDERIAMGGTGKTWIAATALYREYSEWCVENGLRAVSSHKWGRRLVERGVQKRKTVRGREYCVPVSEFNLADDLEAGS